MNIICKTLIVAAVCGTFMAGITGPACSKANDSSLPACEITKDLDDLFTPMFPENEPGALVMVMHNDSIVYDRGFGIANFETGAAVTDSTLFNVCSITKQFSAIAILKLAEQGLLSIDDPITKFFPDLTNPIYNGITLRHLLSHSSGLPDIRPRTEADWQKYPAAHNSRFGRVKDYRLYSNESETMMMFSVLDSLAFEPGTAYEYQNPTYQLIYYIVNSVTGRNYAKWMTDNILRPAGMYKSFFFKPNRNYRNIAHGYCLADSATDSQTRRSYDGRWAECDYGETNFFVTQADGGLYTSGREFMNWKLTFYNDSIISADSRYEAVTPVIDTDEPYTSYGLGFFIERRPDRPRKIYHTGDNGGFFIFEGTFPEERISYLIFATRADWDRLATAAKVDSILETHGWI